MPGLEAATPVAVKLVMAAAAVGHENPAVEPQTAQTSAQVAGAGAGAVVAVAGDEPQADQAVAELVHLSALVPHLVQTTWPAGLQRGAGDVSLLAHRYGLF